jgi:hypothetical protein
MGPAEPKRRREELSPVPTRLRIRQYNDPEILEFFIKYGVGYDLVGDHLFIIRSRTGDFAAGPGDWIVAGPDGWVDVERGDYALRAQQAIARAKGARCEPSKVVQETELMSSRPSTRRRASSGSRAGSLV